MGNKHSAFTYDGVCPKCSEQSDANRWLKTTGNTSHYYCGACETCFDVEFKFNVLSVEDTKARLDELNHGVIIFQRIPNMISGLRAEQVHVYNYEEMLEVPWIDRFRRHNVAGDDFKYFALAGSNAEIDHSGSSIADSKYRARYILLLAQYENTHWVVGHIQGNPACLGLAVAPPRKR